MRKSLLVLSALLLFGAAFAQDPPDVITVIGRGAAPTNVQAHDVPNDGGENLRVEWTPSSEVGFTIFGYEIQVSESASGPFFKTRKTDHNTTSVRINAAEDVTIRRNRDYWVKVVALDSTTIAIPDTLENDSVAVHFVSRLRRSESAAIGPVQSHAAWFNWNRINILVMILIFFALIKFMVYRAHHGLEMKFRRIAGIDAIDEAIGRATELGKPVLYVPGTQNIENIQTIASIQLLTAVSSKAANYDIPIIVPLNRAFMVGIAEEAVKQGFMNAGRPDAYIRDNVRYLSDEQFAFTSGTTGIMMREKSAAHFYLGAFYAESLILSETGFMTGAIQIAGTANTHQLPFFVVACDYTLIGEEYFATSALVTRDVDSLGTLKATDYVKAILILILLTSMALEMFDVQFLRSWFAVI